MTSYPVLFGYRDVVTGRNFVAFIKADGRALLAKENDGYWLFGVQPGGLSAGGKEVSEASREFKMRYLSVLFDIAEEAASFEAFKSEVEQFFGQTSASTQMEWEEAHARVRSGELSHDGLPRRDAASRPPRIEILELDDGVEREPADYNVFDEFAEAA